MELRPNKEPRRVKTKASGQQGKPGRSTRKSSDE